MPSPISGDLHMSVEMASALMISCKGSKIETQSQQLTGSLHPFLIFLRVHLLVIGSPWSEEASRPSLPTPGLWHPAQCWRVAQNPVTREMQETQRGHNTDCSPLANEATLDTCGIICLKSALVQWNCPVFCLNNSSTFLLFDEDFSVSKFKKKDRWIKGNWIFS